MGHYISGENNLKNIPDYFLVQATPFYECSDNRICFLKITIYLTPFMYSMKIKICLLNFIVHLIVYPCAKFHQFIMTLKHTTSTANFATN